MKNTIWMLINLFAAAIYAHFHYWGFTIWFTGMFLWYFADYIIKEVKQ